MIELTEAELERYWRRVHRSSGCWLWAGEKNNQGYGRFAIYRAGVRRRLLTHRVAVEIAIGQDCSGQMVLHGCDNPPCCNPAHLRLGSQRENVADARARARSSPPPHWRGESHPRARLTEAQVAEIRRLHGSGQATQEELGTRFGVNQTTVSRIVRGMLRGAA